MAEIEMVYVCMYGQVGCRPSLARDKGELLSWFVWRCLGAPAGLDARGLSLARAVFASSPSSMNGCTCTCGGGNTRA